MPQALSASWPCFGIAAPDLAGTEPKQVRNFDAVTAQRNPVGADPDRCGPLCPPSISLFHLPPVASPESPPIIHGGRTLESMLHRKRLDRNAIGPLAGVRVLDLSRVLVGNALTVQLGDFGADVIKIEQPGDGDALRGLSDADVPVYWKVLCRNKKSIVVDLKQPEGIALLRRLASWAHVLVENFKPGTLEQFGLAPDELHRLNKKLVIVRVSGWGGTGFPDGPPLLPNLGLADLVCGLNGAIATLVALREAERPDGEGQVIDLGILDAMAALLSPDAGAYASTGKVPQRVGNRGAVVAPRNLYQTADNQYLALSCSTQSMMVKLANAMGRPDIMADPRFRTNVDRVQHVDALDTMVAAFVASRTLAENLVMFDSFKITAGPVNDVSQFMRDPHVIEREILVDIEDPDVGWLPMPQPPARLSATPASIRSAAPRLGEHTREILSDLGCSQDQIQDLLRRGVVEAAAGP